VARWIPTAPGALWRAALLPSAVTLVALAGCGTAENGNFDRGRQLFVAQCGSCHTLAEAATTGTQGPNLDAAFAQARADGMDPDTIAGVVRAQVENPRPPNAAVGESNPSVTMPPDLVTGNDLSDVATYVSQVAGVPGIKPPKAPGGPGGQVFAQNGCGGCHTLKVAQSSGTTGPDLDKVLAGMSSAEIKQSIVDPNKKITPGFPPNVMPQNFGQTINPKDLNLLVNFLITSTGGGGSSSGGGGSSSSGGK
jgi:mono/diheme cytochrome c family protein